MWLAYLDANYGRHPDIVVNGVRKSGSSFAWPRRLVLKVSDDRGDSFGASRILSSTGSDQALAVDQAGSVYVAWSQTDRSRTPDTGRPGEAVTLNRIIVQRFGPDGQPGQKLEPLSWDEGKRQHRAYVSVDSDGRIHVLGVDVGELSVKPPLGDQPLSITLPAPAVLYAQSQDGGLSFTIRHRIERLSVFPQIAANGKRILIVDPYAYVRSQDGGRTFSSQVARRFGDKLVRIAQSPDSQTIYLVGDSPSGGLKIYRSTDEGGSWKAFRVDDAPRATAWRYPAIHVERSGRVHVVWMDDRSKSGAVYHAYSDDGAQTFSPSSRVSDQDFQFPADAPSPPPANQKGTWIGAYMSITSVSGKLIVAWSDQRTGVPKSIVQYVTGTQDP